MYYIVYLPTGDYYLCNTKLEVISIWFTRIHNLGRYDSEDTKTLFKELNVTGNDTMKVTWFDDKTYEYLRPYQVLDENDRSCDIRTWTEEIELFRKGISAHLLSKVVKKGEVSRYRVDPICGIRKGHSHRSQGPAMWKRSMQEIEGLNLYTCSVEGEDELPSTKYNVKFRDRGIGVDTIWNGIESKWFNKYSSSKCWKDQTKARKQWGKRAKGTLKTESLSTIARKNSVNAEIAEIEEIWKEQETALEEEYKAEAQKSA